MLNADDAAGQAKTLQDWHISERQKLDQVRRYWKARQKLPAVIPSSAPAEVRTMARMSRVNVCDIVVASLTQSLFIDGFRVGNDAENVPVWMAWQANRMDKHQSSVHRAATAYGTAYTVVMPGDSFPVMRGVSPRRMTALYGADPDWPTYALERTGATSFRMYDSEAVYLLRSQADYPAGRFDLEDVREHGFGVPPVVRFQDEVDLDADDEVDGISDVLLGQVAPLMSLQDQIDLTTFGLLVAQHYSAFRQRYIMGWTAESETQLMKASASQLWTFADHPEDVKAGEFSETNLKGYIESRDAALRYAATLSQTPVHELIGEMVNLSAEALAAAEAGRDRKVDERKTSFGESWEQTFQLVGAAGGIPVPDDAQVVWRDTSARSFAAVVDGLGKLVQMLGVPPQELWERVPGATQQDVERWKAKAAEGDPMSVLAEMVERQAAPLEAV